MRTIKIKVKPQLDRLDKFLTKELKEFSRSQIQKLIEDGLVRVNQEIVNSSYKIRKSDSIAIQMPPPSSQEIKAQDIPLKKVYEDTDILVVDKPSGMVTHPTSDHKNDTLVNALLFHYQELKGVGEDIRPGIVHRLDKDTSGLIVVAKNETALEDLKKQFLESKVLKKYIALVHGDLKKDFGEIKGNIGRDPIKKLKFAVVEEGKEAVTFYKVIKHFNKFTLVELEPKTGRTHQLRVHLSHLGYPIVGDRSYGGKMLLNRHFLHAKYLSFIHPRTKEKMEFKSDLPKDLQQFLEKIV